MTIFVVGSQNVASSPLADANGMFISTGDSVYINRAGSDGIGLRMRSSTPISDLGKVNGTFYSLVGSFDGVDTQDLRINGVDTGYNTTSGAFTPAPLELFYSTGFGGAAGNKQIAEVLVYARKLTGPEIADVENYLRTKYAHY